jgi:hypothetical protein
MGMAERGELDEVLIVAQWRPGGRGGRAEGGCWGWCMAKDWLSNRLGEDGWAKADALASARARTHHAAAVEDALSSTMSAACDAAVAAGLSPIGASLSAYGGQGRRVAGLGVSYLSMPEAQALSLRARDAFFAGLAHGSQTWSASEPDPRVGEALHAMLAPARAAWLERAALEKVCAAQSGEVRETRL